MEIIAIRFQEEVLKNIDKAIAKHNFNSRTEFIREAVRTKLERISTEEAIRRLSALRGTAKTTTSDEELEEIREKVFLETLKKHNIKSN